FFKFKSFKLCVKFRHFEETASYLFILFQLQYDSKNIVQNLESCLLLMEQQKTVKNNKTTNNEVVLRISNNQEIRDFGATQVAETSSHSKGSHAEELIELENVRSSFLGRSEFSKPKARMVEPPLPKDASFVAEKTQIKNSNSPNKKVLPRDVPDGIGTVITPRTPLIGTPREGEEVDDDDDEEEVYKTAEIEVSKRSGKKMKLMSWIELFAFVSILGFLIASLMVHNLQHKKIWSLELWKWCVLTLVIISGRLVTSWFINVLVFLIERNFLFKKKVLYFVYGVRKSVQAFIWLSLVLLAWSLVFHHGVKRTRKVTTILGYITRALASFVI
ncbi:Mechanosensitive ion channel protein 10, variant 2, partial [Lathyrus oleraceus]